MKALVVALATTVIAMIVGFVLFLLALRIFVGIDILFYRGLVACGVAAVSVGLVVALYHGRGDPALVLAAAMTSLSFNLAFLIVLPVTIDRSISVFLLSRIEAEDMRRPLDADGLRAVFVRDYVVDMRQIERRIAEQQSSGNITVSRGALHLTPRGARFMRFARTLQWIFGTDPRFVGADERPTAPLH